MGELFDLTGKVAVITGSSRGIGKAIAERMAEHGAKVVVNDLGGSVEGRGGSHSAADAVVAEIKAAGGEATLVPLDLTDMAGIDRLGGAIHERWGKLDIFVGAAGILGPLSPLGHVTADAWQAVVDVNLSANWRLIRTLDPLLKKSDAGRAVLVSSGRTPSTP